MLEIRDKMIIWHKNKTHFYDFFLLIYFVYVFFSSGVWDLSRIVCLRSWERILCMRWYSAIQSIIRMWLRGILPATFMIKFFLSLSHFFQSRTCSTMMMTRNSANKYTNVIISLILSILFASTQICGRTFLPHSNTHHTHTLV